MPSLGVSSRGAWAQFLGELATSSGVRDRLMHALIVRKEKLTKDGSNLNGVDNRVMSNDKAPRRLLDTAADADADAENDADGDADGDIKEEDSAAEAPILEAPPSAATEPGTSAPSSDSDSFAPTLAPTTPTHTPTAVPSTAAATEAPTTAPSADASTAAPSASGVPDDDSVTLSSLLQLVQYNAYAAGAVALSVCALCLLLRCCRRSPSAKVPAAEQYSRLSTSDADAGLSRPTLGMPHSMSADSDLEQGAPPQPRVAREASGTLSVSSSLPARQSSSSSSSSLFPSAPERPPSPASSRRKTAAPGKEGAKKSSPTMSDDDDIFAVSGPRLGVCAQGTSLIACLFVCCHV